MNTKIVWYCGGGVHFPKKKPSASAGPAPGKKNGSLMPAAFLAGISAGEE